MSLRVVPMHLGDGRRGGASVSHAATAHHDRRGCGKEGERGRDERERRERDERSDPHDPRPGNVAPERALEERGPRQVEGRAAEGEQGGGGAGLLARDRGIL
jgi:hypothetical protein